MQRADRLRRLSHWLFWTSTVLAWLLPLALIAKIAKGVYDPATLVARFPALPPGTVVSPFAGNMVAALAVAALFPMIAAFMAMRSLFDRYRRGEILTDACADDIGRIGRALFVVAAMTVILPFLQLIVLSAPGQLVFGIGVSDSTLGFLLSGGVLIAIGRVMGEAARLAEENRGFV